MPPLGPGLTEDTVARLVQDWLEETHGLIVCPRYSLNLAEPLPDTWKPAVIGVDLVAGQPGAPPTWIIEVIGDLNNAPHYQVHFSGCLYTLLTRTREDDEAEGRRLVMAFPFFPEGKVPSPYLPVLRRLRGTRFLNLGLELLVVSPEPKVAHYVGEEVERFLMALPEG